MSDLLIFLGQCGNSTNLLSGKKYEDLLREYNEAKFFDGINIYESNVDSHDDINQELSKDIGTEDFEQCQKENELFEEETKELSNNAKSPDGPFLEEEQKLEQKETIQVNRCF